MHQPETHTLFTDSTASTAHAFLDLGEDADLVVLDRAALLRLHAQIEAALAAIADC